MSQLKSMFINNKSDRSEGLIYKTGALLPILTAESLLSQRQYQFYLEQLKSLSLLPEEHFELNYFKLVHVFAEYVQWLPRAWGEPLGSLLNYSLERAMRALYHFAEEYPSAGPADRFAMFSGALIKDVAAIVINQKIFVTDLDGNTKFEWQPFAGAMTHQTKGEYYRMMSLGKYFQRTARAVTLLLVRQIIPESGFLWIASFPQLFAEWLEVIEDDKGGGGRLRKILQLYEIPVAKSPKVNLPAIEGPMIDSKATTYADLFLTWLKEALAKNELSVNAEDSNVFVTENGVFLDKKVFQQFKNIYDVPVEMLTVYAQFGNLFGIPKRGGEDHRFEQLFAPKDVGVKQNFLGQNLAPKTQTREGVLLGEPALIFERSIPDVTANLRSTSNAQTNLQRLPNVVVPRFTPNNRM